MAEPLRQGALLFYSKFDDPGEWRSHLVAAMPSLDVRVYPDIGAPEDIAYALVWKPPLGFFTPLNNLKLVINLGAGVDAIAARTDMPKVPVMRLADPDMVEQMTSYVVAAVLRYTRDFDRFEGDTRARRWTYVHPRRQRDVAVGIMGLGALGLPAAQALKGLGLAVRGWSRTAKDLPFPSFYGDDQLSIFLAGLDVLVLMLPLTAQTRGMMDDRAFAAMDPGTALVNASRGEIIEETALAQALVGGRLRGATLDAFITEPLPADHPLRELPNVLITPHIASIAGPHGSAPQIIANIRRLATGEPLHHMADLSHGY